MAGSKFSDLTGDDDHLYWTALVIDLHWREGRFIVQVFRHASDAVPESAREWPVALPRL